MTIGHFLLGIMHLSNLLTRSLEKPHLKFIVSNCRVHTMGDSLSSPDGCKPAWNCYIAALM